MLRGVLHVLAAHTTLCWLMMHHALTALMECHPAVILLTYSPPLFAMHPLLNPQSAWLSSPSLHIFTSSSLRCHTARLSLVPLICEGLTVWSFSYIYQKLLNPCAVCPLDYIRSCHKSVTLSALPCAHSHNNLQMSNVTGLQRVQDQATHVNTHIRTLWVEVGGGARWTTTQLKGLCLCCQCCPLSTRKCHP